MPQVVHGTPQREPLVNIPLVNFGAYINIRFVSRYDDLFMRTDTSVGMPEKIVPE
jgi:hypothetical protein